MKTTSCYLVFLFLASQIWAVQTALDISDSLKVRGILDAVGWTGIKVREVVFDPAGQVVALPEKKGRHISFLNLNARPGFPAIRDLPGDVGKLPELTTLLLAGNELKTLPREIMFLRRLSRLDISTNRFDNLPGWLGQLRGLNILEADNNALSVLPDSLALATNLTALKMSGNKFTVLPDWIGELDLLRALFVANNQLSTLPEKLTARSDIQIDARNNRLCSLSPELSHWMDSHQVGGEWRLAQECEPVIAPDYSFAIVEGITGTLVRWYDFPDRNDDPVVTAGDNSALPSQDGWVLLKAVTIVAANTEAITDDKIDIVFTYGDVSLEGLDTTSLTICVLSSAGKWEYLGGTVETDGKTVSVVVPNQGTYGLLAKTGESVTGAQPMLSSPVSSSIAVRYGVENRQLVLTGTSMAAVRVRLIGLDGTVHTDFTIPEVRGMARRITLGSAVPSGSYLVEITCENQRTHCSIIVR